VNDTIAELAINRLTIIPFTVHSLFQAASVRDNVRLRGSVDDYSLHVVL
jgi:hypothetical protein